MSNLSQPDLQYSVPRSMVRDTLSFLRRHGRHTGEGVVLWAGSLQRAGCTLRALLIPAQHTTVVSFRIAHEELVRIINWTADNNVVLAVQIHSHPEEAFHSEADDHLALLQHLHAISIVVPDFGNIPDDRFFADAAFFTLRSRAHWTPLASAEISHRFHLLEENHELDYPPHPNHHRS